MIISTDGNCCKKTETGGTVTMIVSATGTAYTKKGKIRAIIRFVKKIFTFVKTKVKLIDVVVRKFLNTRSGKPTSIEPPSNFPRYL